MRRTATRGRWAVVAASALLVAASHGLRGQEPATKAATPGENRPPWLTPARPKEAVPKPGHCRPRTRAAIRPLPLEAIPDDPPPHEGAMFELSYRIEAPDLVLVEILEALPGRPITGEHLVRQDGTIALGWYGEVHVAGLTCEQAKVKIIHHLRPVLNDEALGLVTYDDGHQVDRARQAAGDGREGPCAISPGGQAGRGGHARPG